MNRKSIRIVALLFLMLIRFTVPVKAAQLEYKKYIPDILYATSIKSDEKAFDLRTDANLLNEKFHILQGGCTDGTYAYYCMACNVEGDPYLNYCKIIKVDLHLNDTSDIKVPETVGVSDPLPIDHGNDLTFISTDTSPYYGKLAVVHCLKEDYDLNPGVKTEIPNTCISIIDRDSLNIVETKTVDCLVKDGSGQYLVPEANGLDSDQLQALEKSFGFDGIAYNKSADEFAVLRKDGGGDFFILDNQLNLVRYLDTSRETGYLNQGIDCVYYDPAQYPAYAEPSDTETNYIVLCQSQKGSNKGNILAIYDWNTGQLEKTIALRGMRYEVENVFHIGDVFYASCYAYDKDYAQRRFGFLYTFGETETVYGVSLNHTALKLTPTSSAQLTAKVVHEKAANKNVTWTSSNSSVARVSATGRVTALKKGTATIKVRTVEGNFVASCKVTVYKEAAKTPSGMKLKLKVKYKKKKNKKIINKKKSYLKVTWNKVGKPTGYRVYISTNKKFKKSKIYTIRNCNTKKLVFHNLKKGKTYYVKVQSFVQYGSDITYSSFTKARKKKVKK